MIYFFAPFLQSCLKKKKKNADPLFKVGVNEMPVRPTHGDMSTGHAISDALKWMQHRDFPGGHPSQYYSGPKALNFRVLMGSGVVALV